MKLYLLRHLQTEWNLERRLQGRRNIDILAPNLKIQENIQRNKTILEGLPSFDLVLVSRLKRTQQTAVIYGFNEYWIESLLDELDFGIFEGQLTIVLKSSFKEEWIKNPRNLQLGESLIELENRIIGFLTKYQELKNILAFGHGAWIRGLLSMVEYGDLDKMNTHQFKLNHNELLKVEIDEINNREYIGSWQRLN